jgi:UDP-glucose 4-epimerase
VKVFVTGGAGYIGSIPIPAVEKPRRAGDPPRLIASSEKAKRELNWKPRFADFEAIVESAWHWSVAHPNGYSA